MGVVPGSWNNWPASGQADREAAEGSVEPIHEDPEAVVREFQARPPPMHLVDNYEEKAPQACKAVVPEGRSNSPRAGPAPWHAGLPCLLQVHNEGAHVRGSLWIVPGSGGTGGAVPEQMR